MLAMLVNNRARQSYRCWWRCFHWQKRWRCSRGCLVKYMGGEVHGRSTWERQTTESLMVYDEIYLLEDSNGIVNLLIYKDGDRMV